mmetsp:Transcript_31781/g.99195  ORF Transcript_31781/g.99195 Transcript_31781/m.99195 type:complete len:412 (+) Transcript_31781:106-1341(+)
MLARRVVLLEGLRRNGQDDVVPVAGLCTSGVAQQFLELGGLVAADPLQLLRGEVDDGPRDLCAPVHQSHALVAQEAPADPPDAHGQQALLVGHGLGGPVVQDKLTGARQAQDPAPRVTDSLHRIHSHEVSSLRLWHLLAGGAAAVVEEAVEAPGVGAVDEAAGDPRRGRRPRRHDLRGHPAGAEAAAGGAGVHLQRPGLPHHAQRLGRRVHPRVRGVEEVHVREEEEAVRVELHRGQRRQVVVVAKAELWGVRGVVLVDHWNNAQSQALEDGVLYVAPVLLLHEVALADEQLGHLEPDRAKEVFVHAHELALARRRHGLLGAQGGGLLLQPQLDAAHTNGAGGDKHYLVTLALELGDQLHDLRDVGELDPLAAAVGNHQRRGPDLEDQEGLLMLLAAEQRTRSRPYRPPRG